MATFARPTALPIVEFGGVDQGFSTMRVTSPYGNRDGGFHGGLDIGNYRAGDTITAIAAGKVIMASGQPVVPWSYPSPTDKLSTWGASYGGNVTVIDHGDGQWSQYAHQQRMDVRVNDMVHAMQPIGLVGDTGSAYGQAHLHFGIRLASAYANGHNGFVDPWPLITPTGDALPDTAMEGDPMLLFTAKGYTVKEPGADTYDAPGGSVIGHFAPGIALTSIGKTLDGQYRMVAATFNTQDHLVYIKRSDLDPVAGAGNSFSKSVWDLLLSRKVPPDTNTLERLRANDIADEARKTLKSIATQASSADQRIAGM